MTDANAENPASRNLATATSASWVTRMVDMLDNYPVTVSTNKSINAYPTIDELRQFIAEGSCMMSSKHRKLLGERMDVVDIERSIDMLENLQLCAKSLSRTVQKEMYVIGPDQHACYNGFMEWLYRKRSGVFPDHGCVFPTSNQCLAPTKRNRKCKLARQSEYGLQLPGTCWIHTPTHVEFVAWLDTCDDECMQHIKECVIIWKQSSRIIHGVETLANCCRTVKSMITRQSTLMVPKQLRSEWNKCDQLGEAFNRMALAVEGYDELLTECHDWAKERYPTCPICMDFLSKDRSGSVRLQCTHDLCLPCFKKLDQSIHHSSSKCPICRTNI